MKRIISTFLLCAAVAASAYAAPVMGGVEVKSGTIQLAGKSADGPMGIGIFLGQPSGITFELDISQSSWLDFKAAWNLAGGASFSILLQANYEYAFPGLIAIETEVFTPFFGAGVLLGVNSGGISIGGHVPGGVSYRFRNIPLELFIEAGLDVYLFPALAFGGASGGLGARYRF